MNDYHFSEPKITNTHTSKAAGAKLNHSNNISGLSRKFNPNHFQCQDKYLDQ